MKNLRSTKIICTIGPVSQDTAILKELINAGMNVARINCSHGKPNDRIPVVSNLLKVRRELDYPLAIMLDTKGPEFRIKSFKQGSIELKDGDTFSFFTEDVEGDKSRVSVTYKDLCKEMNPGDIILANDGLVKFEVVSIKEPCVVCKVIVGGILNNNKSLNFPGKELNIEYLSETDKKDLLFAIKYDIDFIACSFVSCADDLKSVRDFLDKNGGKNITLIAKIENQSGIDNLDDIAEFCDGIMVARGDLGVEIDYDNLPVVQKGIIKKCNLLSKISITSTEMLESMIENPRPTRAEVSDVANAIYDGTSAIMLSGETAVGKYPVESVKVMAKIAKSTEDKISYIKKISSLSPVACNRAVDAIAKATCNIAIDVDAKAIVNLSASGFTSELISGFRPHVDVLTFTLDMKEFYKLAIFWGINPIKADEPDEWSNLQILEIIRKELKNVIGLHDDDGYVLCTGWRDEEVGYTNSISVETV